MESLLNKEEISLKAIKCKNCGAELYFDPNTQNTVCNFCGSHFEIENAIDEIISQPELIIPFKVDKNTCFQKVMNYLAQGNYTPDDLLESGFLTEYNGVYLPMYKIKGIYSGNWSASSGYYRTVQYTERDSQGKLVRKTRTVTDWAPSNGSFQGSYGCLSLASPLQSDIADLEAFIKNNHWQDEDIKQYDSRYILGFNLVKLSLDINEAWSLKSDRQLYAVIDRDAKARIPGDTFKDLVFDYNFKISSSKSIYVPYWIMFYKYKGLECYCCMDGFSGEKITGTRPEDKTRKDLVRKYFYKGHVALVISILSLFLLINYPQAKMFLTYFCIVSIIGTIVSYIWGAFQKNRVIKASKEFRMNLLRKYTNK